MTPTLTVAEVLERAADLIEPEGAWTKGVYFRDAKGFPTEDAEQACKFCTLGAIRAAGGYDRFSLKDSNPATLYFEEVVDTTFGVHGWNDAPGRTQAEVVAKLREAAAKARVQGK